MSKLIMMKGLPASGKTTLAKKLVCEHGNFVRVSRDDIREMLHDGKWSGSKEKITVMTQKAIVKELLSHGINVIIDDTNLTEKHRDRWKTYADEVSAKFEVHEVNTPLEVCLERNKHRDKDVSQQVIWSMALSNGLWHESDSIVLCDIDGTIADIAHRLHHVKDTDSPDWDAFGLGIPFDTPRTEIIEQVNGLAKQGKKIFLLSGRNEKFRDLTEAWVEKHVPFKPVTIIMREEDDRRPDEQVKESMLHLFDKHYDIFRVYDDRPKVIRMWRENGLDVVDVGPGIEF